MKRVLMILIKKEKKKNKKVITTITMYSLTLYRMHFLFVACII